MNMYNMMHGMNARPALALSCYLNLRVDKYFPRFRDVFTGDEDCLFKEDEYDFLVYTRMGGGNSECWEDYKENCDCPACRADKLEKEDFVIGRYNDSEDSTYCTFVVKLTEEQKKITNEELVSRREILFKDIIKKQKEVKEQDNESRR